MTTARTQAFLDLLAEADVPHEVANDAVGLAVQAFGPGGFLPQLGGDGGAIALDAKGNIAMPFNTDGMYRGWVDKSGKVHVAIFKD